MHNNDKVVIFIGVLILIAVFARRRWKASTTAFGTACWASDSVLKAKGMLGKVGLIVGRTMKGQLIRAASYCHVLLVGATRTPRSVTASSAITAPGSWLARRASSAIT